MARGRFIGTAIAYDPEFNEMSLTARFLFLCAIPHLDRDGLLPAHPSTIWSMIAPLQPELLHAIPSAIEEWKRAGGVVSYSTRAGDVLHFVNFHKHQTGLMYEREAPSRFESYMPLEFTQQNSRPKSRPKSRVTRDSSRDEVLPKGEVEVKDQVQDQGQGKPTQNGGDGDAAQLGAVYRCYEENISLLNQIVSDDLGNLVDTHGAENVIRAIQETARNNGRTVRYVAKVLDNWAAGNIRSATSNGHTQTHIAVPPEIAELLR